MSNQYEDDGARQSKSVQSLFKSAKSCFDKFALKCVDYPFNKYEEVTDADFTQVMIGKFSNFIANDELAKGITRWTTHKNYVSSIYHHLSIKYPRQVFEDYMTTLYSNIEKTYKAREGPLIEHTDQMKVKERDYINRRLFAEGQHEKRCICACDWVGVGRISEVLHYVFFH